MDKRILTLDDLSHLPPPIWLIEGLFELTSLVMLFGPSGNYKSFLALDWMLSVVTGRPWNGKPVLRAKVLYALGEGKSSLLKRVQAWSYHHKLSQEEVEKVQSHFRVTFEVPQLARPESVTNLLNDCKSANFEPNVLVIDTFARSAVGVDENSQLDTGKWIESADRLRQLGMTVLFLHHTSKGSEVDKEGNQSLYPKYRGSTAIKAAMDSAFGIIKDQKSGTVILRTDKQKDHDEGKPFYFNILKVLPPGNPVSHESIVLVPQSQQIDERFTSEGQLIETTINTLLTDSQFKSDKDRAEALTKLFPSMSMTAARTRISRRRKEHESIH